MWKTKELKKRSWGVLPRETRFSFVLEAVSHRSRLSLFQRAFQSHTHALLLTSLMRELSTTRLTHAPPLRPSSQVSQFAQFIIGDRLGLEVRVRKRTYYLGLG